MLPVFQKEINLFLSSLTGYVTIIVFLVATGLFMWVFPDTSLLEYGYATLGPLFQIAPWVFLFLIPAITMRSFSEERSLGTIEMLTTKPLTDLQIITGKFFAAWFLVIFSILPTLIYVFSVYYLGDPPGNLDTGATIGSYIGLILLGGGFTAIGLFASSLTENQIVAFIIALFLCFLFYSGFDYLSRLEVFYGTTDNIVRNIGIRAHYNSISRGVLDTRDLIYFFSLIGGFILFTRTSLGSRKW